MDPACVSRIPRVRKNAPESPLSGSQSEAMSALDWDHNAYYHRLLLRHLPRPCSRVLDVGCGAGAFAAKLATRAGHVDALDRSPAMIEQARSVVPANVT